MTRAAAVRAGLIERTGDADADLMPASFTDVTDDPTFVSTAGLVPVMATAPRRHTKRRREMGFLSRLFSGSAASDDEGAAGAETTLTCDSCGCEVDEEDMENGQCEECYSNYSGPKYCCGAIYEEGEDTCRSCGEAL